MKGKAALMIVEARIKKITANIGRGSVHVDFGNGGITISDILVRDVEGMMKVTMPLVNVGENKRPCVTLQGTMKEVVFSALLDAYKNAEK